MPSREQQAMMLVTWQEAASGPHSMVSQIRVAYVDYLFKFAKQFDPRLDNRRLVMSQPMTSAARELWIDITRPNLRRRSP